MNRFLNDGFDASLAAPHAAVTAGHAGSRARLLRRLPEAGDDRATPARWRYALGGIGLGSAAAVALLLAVLLGRSSVAAAVERVGRAVERVASYSYRMQEEYVSTKEDRRVETVVEGRWRRDPIGVGATTKIWITSDFGAEPPGPREQTVDIAETHRAGERGVLVDHLRRHFWRCDPIDASNFGGGSPAAVLYKVRQQRGKVLRDLGEKLVDGRPARGVELLLDGSAPETELGPATPESPAGQARGWDWRNVRVELWYDPTTDLPIEFRTVRRGDDFTTTIRYTRLRWNLDFPRGTFDPTAPEGYEELPGPPGAADEE